MLPCSAVWALSARNPEVSVKTKPIWGGFKFEVSGVKQEGPRGELPSFTRPTPLERLTASLQTGPRVQNKANLPRAVARISHVRLCKTKPNPGSGLGTVACRQEQAR